MRAMIETLFPDNIKIIVADPYQIREALYPVEEELIERAHTNRRLEFKAGRVLAKRLLAEFGISNFPLLMGKKREPVWPENMCGSITHAIRICAVVAARKSEVESLGIDVVCPPEVKKEIWHIFCADQELEWLQDSPEESRQNRAALIFSAKETLYKCLYPLVQIWINFKDVAITFNEESHEFHAQFIAEKKGKIEKGKILTGKYIDQFPYILTGMTILNRNYFRGTGNVYEAKSAHAVRRPVTLSS